MNSTLTVAKARAQLAAYVPNSATEFIEKLNQVCERAIYVGKFNGTFVVVDFANVENYITLPPRYLGVLAGTIDKVPVQTFSQWQPYMEVGWCLESDALVWGWGRLQDMGDGYVTTVDIDESGPIQVFSTAPDNAQIVRLFGVDADTGYPVIDSTGAEGENVTLAAPSVTTTHNFSSLTGIQKDVTKGPITLKVDPTNGDPVYTISTVQSWETAPSWRRYWIGPGQKTVRLLCQRRFIPVSFETDLVWPDSVGALKMGLKGLALEDSGGETTGAAQICWDQMVKILNQAARSTRAGNVIPVPVNAWGWRQPIKFTN